MALNRDELIDRALFGWIFLVGCALHAGKKVTSRVFR